MDKERLITQLTTDEGKRNKPYRDTVGKLTIGVGRNLDDRGLSDDEIAYLLSNDLKIVERELDVHLTWWRGMCDARQNALANAAFNLGVPRLLLFKKALGFLRAGEYEKAASEFLESKWATQVGGRAKRIAESIKTGQLK